MKIMIYISIRLNIKSNIKHYDTKCVSANVIVMQVSLVRSADIQMSRNGTVFSKPDVNSTLIVTLRLIVYLISVQLDSLRR